MKKLSALLFCSLCLTACHPKDEPPAGAAPASASSALPQASAVQADAALPASAPAVMTPTDTASDNTDPPTVQPQAITAEAAALLAQKRGEEKSFSLTQDGVSWTVFEASTIMDDMDDNSQAKCYWRVVRDKPPATVQAIFQETGYSACSRDWVLDYEPRLLQKDALILDLPSERGGVMYVFHLTSTGIKVLKKPYQGQDDDSLTVTLKNNVIHAKTLEETFQIQLDNQKAPWVSTSSLP